MSLFTAASPTRNPLVRRVVDQVHTRLDADLRTRHRPGPLGSAHTT